MMMALGVDRLVLVTWPNQQAVCCGSHGNLYLQKPEETTNPHTHSQKNGLVGRRLPVAPIGVARKEDCCYFARSLCAPVNKTSLFFYYYLIKSHDVYWLSTSGFHWVLPMFDVCVVRGEGVCACVCPACACVCVCMWFSTFAVVICGLSQRQRPLDKTSMSPRPT